MKKVLCFFIVLSISLISLSNCSKSSVEKGDLQIEKKEIIFYPPTPDYFTENKGQWESNILFAGDTSFGKVAFAKDGIYYQIMKATESKEGSAIALSENPAGSLSMQDSIKKFTFESQTTKLSFVDALTPVLEGVEVLSHYNNYYIGNDPLKWASECRNYTKVSYKDIWSGIDLAYYFTPEGMKYEYYVTPEANIEDLQIKVEGAEISGQDTSLKISTKIGDIQDSKLKVYEQGTNTPLDAKFEIVNDIYQFSGIPAKREKSIVIDPLVFSTYIGGNSIDTPKKVNVDSSGNVLIAGVTMGGNFPATSIVNQTSAVSSLGFVSKLNSTCSSLIFSTYFGGNIFNNDLSGFEIDSNNNLYVTGDTYSSDFPTTPGAYQTIHKNPTTFIGPDGFLMKLNSTASAIIFSTFFGGSKADFITDLVVDKAGRSYIAGYTTSSDLPVSKDAYQNALKGPSDTFVSKFNSSGSELLYSSYLGGSGDEYNSNSKITVNSSGDIYIAGNTKSSDFPLTQGAYQNNLKSMSDLFVTKLHTSGKKLDFSTYLGGTQDDYVNRISLDASNNLLIAGFTNSANFPITPNVVQSIHKGIGDGFITKLNALGSALIFSTFIGGSANEQICDFKVDQSGNILAAGYTHSTDFPMITDAYQPINKGPSDAFIIKLNSTCTNLLYSTYVGGSKIDGSYGICLDPTGNAIITGSAISSDFPTTSGVYQTIFKGGNSDGFIAKFSFEPVKTGVINFTSNPSKAKILINGVEKGETPLKISLPIGSYTATFTLSGYENLTMSLNVSDRRNKPIHGDLKKKIVKRK